MPKDQFYFLHGIFKVFLWNWGSWIKIVIDDKLAIDDDKLIFSSSRCSTVFWFPLVEKAVAKLYGSYQLLSQHCTLSQALTLFTGSPTELIDVEDASQQKNKDLFRLMAEEVSRGSIMLVHSRAQAESVPHGMKLDRYYVVKSIKKPSLGGSFRKKVVTTEAMIEIIPTKWEEEDLKKQDFRLRESWVKVDSLSSCFDSLLVCHHKIKFKKVFGATESQFVFDVTPTGLGSNISSTVTTLSAAQEIMIEVTQQKLHALEKIGFAIFRVEVNREHKLFQLRDPIYELEAVEERSLFRRISLKPSRYILVITGVKPTNIMIRATIPGLKEVSHVQDKISPFTKILSKPPKYVTRCIVKEVHELKKPENARSKSCNMCHWNLL